YMLEERNRPRYAALVLTVSRSPDREAALAALPTLGSWASYEPDIPTRLAELVTRLDGNVAAWRPALTSLVQCALNGEGTGSLLDAARTLSNSLTRFSAHRERDLPALQRLTELTSRLKTWRGHDRTHIDSTITALTDVLPEPLASELVAATLNWRADVEAALNTLASRPMGGVLAIARV
ncbi:hypothetical protein ACFQ07_05955, partial [Actinomadura adrarensis]